jgi:hypothetical protein
VTRRPRIGCLRAPTARGQAELQIVNVAVGLHEYTRLLMPDSTCSCRDEGTASQAPCRVRRSARQLSAAQTQCMSQPPADGAAGRSSGVVCRRPDPSRSGPRHTVACLKRCRGSCSPGWARTSPGSSRPSEAFRRSPRGRSGRSAPRRYGQRRGCHRTGEPIRARSTHDIRYSADHWAASYAA